jgi:hypothetical protein
VQIIPEDSLIHICCGENLKYRQDPVRCPWPNVLPSTQPEVCNARRSFKLAVTVPKANVTKWLRKRLKTQAKI